MGLRTLEKQWLRLWDEMQSIKHPSITLAAPFFSADITAVPRVKERKILLVGKATHKDWFLDQFLAVRDKSPILRLRERLMTVAGFMDGYDQFKTSAFWHLFRALNEQTGAKVIWTNLAKIGVKRPNGEIESINPFGKFLAAQKQLALKTLEAEIREYKPDLVVMVTKGDRVYSFGADVFEGWGKWSRASFNGRSYQFMERTDSHPPVLLVAHPSRKAKAEINAWVKKAGQLMSAPNPTKRGKVQK